MEPYTRNGGIIGKVMDFGATDRYVIGETTELDTIEYVGASTAGYVGATGNYVTSLTALTGGTDSSPQTGDLVIVFFATNPDDIGQISYRISGYTQIADVYALDTERAQLQVGYKFMGATPDTSVTITGGSGDIDQAAVVGIQVWRGVDPTNTFDVTTQVLSQTNTHRPTPPDMTPTTAGSYIIVAGVGGHNGGSDTFSSSNLTNFRSAGANDTHDVILGFGYHQWVSGTFNPATFTSTQADSSLHAAASVSIALRPATVTVPLFGNKKNSGIWDLQAVVEYESILQPGQEEFTTPGTYSWTAPPRVTSVCVVCVGGGGGAGINDGEGDPVIGGAGGGLGWKNDIPVIPGNSYTVVVGAGGIWRALVEGRGGPGGNSYFIDTSTVAGFGGEGGGRATRDPIDAIGGTYVGDGGGNGGNGGTGVSGSSAGGGGGAGGYSGSGGIAGDGASGNGAAGSGGGGGGGSGGGEGDCAGSGGGVGIYGEGASGVGGLHTGADGNPGGGGSGGTAGTQGGEDIRGNGGVFGGGGAGADRITESGNGGSGAVRIIWGAGRAFPSTNTGDL